MVLLVLGDFKWFLLVPVVVLLVSEGFSVVITCFWCGFAGSWRFSVVLLVPGVVLLVFGGFQLFLLVPSVVLLVLGGFQWFLLVPCVVLLALGGFKWFLLNPGVVYCGAPKGLIQKRHVTYRLPGMSL